MDDIIAFCNALQDPVVIVDRAGRIVASNAALQSLLGYAAEGSARLALSTMMVGHRRRELVRQQQACLRGEKVIAVPTELQTRRGRLIPLLLTLSRFRHPAAPDPLVVMTFKETPTPDPSLARLNLILKNQVRSTDLDPGQTVSALEAEVGERRRVENELRVSWKQLRMLSQRTLELLESDRQVIAKELHDSIGASLAAIKFSLEGWLEVYGDRLPSPEIPFERIITHIVETIKETKRISANLRPSTLDDLGLLATARWFCRDLAGLYAGIRINPRFEVREKDIPTALKIVLYRVMQEALSNAAKHSGAKEILVTLSLESGFLEMTIVDDGCGFDLDQVVGAEAALSGFGINSMRERIEICYGSFDIRSRLGEGTRILARLPVAPPVDDDP